MPAAFDRCRSAGGRIRTISGPSAKPKLAAGEYVHVCIDKKGHSHMGYKKTAHAARVLNEEDASAKGRGRT